jgi:hypothetical protein
MAKQFPYARSGVRRKDFNQGVSERQLFATHRMRFSGVTLTSASARSNISEQYHMIVKSGYCNAYDVCR